MRVLIVTPAAPGTLHGNRRTAVRWARHLEALGHEVTIDTAWDGTPQDIMIALHARRSHASLHAWKQRHPARPLVLVLTGTDLYRDIRHDPDARESLAAADRLVVLQEKGLEALAPIYRDKATVIHQSATPAPRAEPPQDEFLVTVIGHLRAEKDPFRTAQALRHVADAHVRVVQLGQAMDADAARTAKALMALDARYRWLGETDHDTALAWLARSHVMVISSRIEGGAHVVSEAIAAGVPVIASRISGNVGLLGDDYPGYFPVEDDAALAALLVRAMREPEFLASLAAHVVARRALVLPATERESIARLLIGLGA